LQLFSFIQADLHAHQSKSQAGLGFSSPVPSTSFDPIASIEPRFPKSLYLIQPLFSSYELNPVAPNAQASVPIPEGLDLDAWIVPPPREVASAAEESLGKKIKRSKKGKGKEGDGNDLKHSRKKRTHQENGGQLTQTEPEIETPEEQAERARVRLLLDLVVVCDANLLFSAKQNGWRYFEMILTISSMIGPLVRMMLMLI
jgi:AP-3 complex subunit delta